MRIEDYGLIGDLQTAALVGRDGSIDWLCMPRFDSAACCAALLGDERHGRWLIAPVQAPERVSRRYRPGTLILETDIETRDGVVRLIDFMPRRGAAAPRVMRIVEGRSGRVPMQLRFDIRPDYASIIPWVEPAADGVLATAGPDAFRLTTAVPVEVASRGSVAADFVIGEGARERFVLTWHPSFEESPPVEDADSALARTEAWWRG
jgi:GH15 family glucan-1,4-alpha-glucosidase